MPRITIAPLDLTQRLVHDLRNPLASLSSNLAYMDERLGPAADPEVKEALLDCKAAVGRLRRAATMLVDLGLLQQGTLAPRRVLTQVAPLLQEVFAQRLHEARLREVKLAAEVPAAMAASFDAELVQRLLHALLDYALRYANPGGTVLVRAERDPKERLLLSMEAEGEWLPPEERAYLQRSAAPEGAASVGLGPHYVNLATEAHAGSLQVLSDAGRKRLAVTITL